MSSSNEHDSYGIRVADTHGDAHETTLASGGERAAAATGVRGQLREQSYARHNS